MGKKGQKTGSGRKEFTLETPDNEVILRPAFQFTGLEMWQFHTQFGSWLQNKQKPDQATSTYNSLNSITARNLRPGAETEVTRTINRQAIATRLQETRTKEEFARVATDITEDVATAILQGLYVQMQGQTKIFEHFFLPQLGLPVSEITRKGPEKFVKYTDETVFNNDRFPGSMEQEHTFTGRSQRMIEGKELTLHPTHYLIDKSNSSYEDLKVAHDTNGVAMVPSNWYSQNPGILDALIIPVRNLSEQELERGMEQLLTSMDRFQAYPTLQICLVSPTDEGSEIRLETIQKKWKDMLLNIATRTSPTQEQAQPGEEVQTTDQAMTLFNAIENYQLRVFTLPVLEEEIIVKAQEVVFDTITEAEIKPELLPTASTALVRTREPEPGEEMRRYLRKLTSPMLETIRDGYPQTGEQRFVADYAAQHPVIPQKPTVPQPPITSPELAKPISRAQARKEKDAQKKLQRQQEKAAEQLRLKQQAQTKAQQKQNLAEAKRIISSPAKKVSSTSPVRERKIIEGDRPVSDTEIQFYLEQHPLLSTLRNQDMARNILRLFSKTFSIFTMVRDNQGNVLPSSNIKALTRNPQYIASSLARGNPEIESFVSGNLPRLEQQIVTSTPWVSRPDQNAKIYYVDTRTASMDQLLSLHTQESGQLSPFIHELAALSGIPVETVVQMAQDMYQLRKSHQAKETQLKTRIAIGLVGYQMKPLEDIEEQTVSKAQAKASAAVFRGFKDIVSTMVPKDNIRKTLDDISLVSEYQQAGIVLEQDDIYDPIPDEAIVNGVATVQEFREHVIPAFRRQAQTTAAVTAKVAYETARYIAKEIEAQLDQDTSKPLAVTVPVSESYVTVVSEMLYEILQHKKKTKGIFTITKSGELQPLNETTSLYPSNDFVLRYTEPVSGKYKEAIRELAKKNPDASLLLRALSYPPAAEHLQNPFEDSVLVYNTRVEKSRLDAVMAEVIFNQQTITHMYAEKLVAAAYLVDPSKAVPSQELALNAGIRILADRLAVCEIEDVMLNKPIHGDVIAEIDQAIQQAEIQYQEAKKNRSQFSVPLPGMKSTLNELTDREALARGGLELLKNRKTDLELYATSPVIRTQFLIDSGIPLNPPRNEEYTEGERTDAFQRDMQLFLNKTTQFSDHNLYPHPDLFEPIPEDYTGGVLSRAYMHLFIAYVYRRFLQHRGYENDPVVIKRRR